jgi:hypothetical protein
MVDGLQLFPKRQRTTLMENVRGISYAMERPLNRRQSGSMQKETKTNPPAVTAPVSLSAWVAQVGVTACTAWRWRKKGWLKVTNICGRLYLSQSAIAEFNERAQRGDFAQEHKAPVRKREKEYQS